MNKKNADEIYSLHSFCFEIMDMKKPLRIGEVLIEKELRLVQSASHTGLLAVGSVLGDDALRSSLVDGGSGNDQIRVGHVVVELLHRGLGSRLDHLVAHGLTLGNADTLDSGLNVRHRNFPPECFKSSTEVVYRRYMENAGCKQKQKAVFAPFPLTPLEEGAAMTNRTSVMRDPARCHGQMESRIQTGLL